VLIGVHDESSLALCEDAFCFRRYPSSIRYSVYVSYQPMTLAGLARFVAAEPDFDSQCGWLLSFSRSITRSLVGHV
jgi:hypothetical protein